MSSRVSSGQEGVGMAGAKGLGRGLDVLLKGISVGSEHPEVILVQLVDVQPNPRQPRLEFDPQALEDLASSIKEQGVLQPILVRESSLKRGQYELVAGERRLRASKLAGLSEIPAILRDVTDEQSLALALIENLQRENLNALEEAKGLDQLSNAFNLSQEALAQKVGKSRSSVANSLRLLQLPEQIQNSLFKDEISAGHARALLSITDSTVQDELWKRVLGAGLSVREAEDMSNHWKEHGDLPHGGALPQRASAGKRKKAPLPEEMTQLVSRLRERFKANVKIGGDETRGKVSFSYASPDELKALVAAWGVDDV